MNLARCCIWLNIRLECWSRESYITLFSDLSLRKWINPPQQYRPWRLQFSTSPHICEQGRVPISIGLNSCVNKTLFWARDERHAPMVATAELFVELGLLKAEDDCRRKRLTRLIDLKNVYSWLKTEVTKVFTFYILTWNYRHRLWFRIFFWKSVSSENLSWFQFSHISLKSRRNICWPSSIRKTSNESQHRTVKTVRSCCPAFTSSKESSTK